MARVKYGAFITEMNGSIGGTSFQQNNSGSIARAKASQKFFPSNLQSGSRSDFATIATSWSTISLSVQALWNAYALANPITDRWGNIRTLTGFQYYMQSNLNLLSLGLTLLASPPTYIAPDIVPAFSATGYTNSLHLNFYPGINFPNSDLVVYATAPTTATKLTNRKNLYLIGGFSSPNASIFDITTMYSNAFGLTWGSFFNSASCNIIFQLLLVNRVTGIASPFTGYVFPLRNYPMPSWSLFGNSYASSGQLFSQTQILDLASDGNGNVYAGTFNSGLLLISRDFGANWSSSGSIFGVTTINSVACNSTGLVLIGTNNGHIWRSIDYGVNFSDLGVLFTQTIITCITKCTESYFIAGTSKTAGTCIFMYSSDYGLTWNNAGVLTGDGQVNRIVYLESGICLAGGSAVGRLYRSTNFGVSWSNVSPLAGYTTYGAMVYLGNGICLFTALSPANFIYRSTDYGLTWASIPLGVVTLAIRNGVYIGNGIVLLGSATGGTLFKSTDYGLTWSSLGSFFSQAALRSFVLPKPNSILIGTSNGGLVLKSL